MPMTKRQIGLLTAEREASRRRYYIELNLRPHPRCTDRWGRPSYVKVVWPILFKTEEEAWAHARACNPFRGGSKWAKPRPHPYIVSYSVGMVRLKEKAGG